LVWYAAKKVHIWDVKKGELLQTVDADVYQDCVRDLRISGDGSKVFCMEWNSIQVWHILTGEVMGKVKLYYCEYYDIFLTIDNSRVWVKSHVGIMGWDFGVPDSSSIKHHREPPNRPSLDLIGGIRE